MGREVRRVPADWEHPKEADGNYIPLFGRSYADDAAEWDEEKRKWDNGFKRAYDIVDQKLEKRWVPKQSDDGCSYEEYDGERPVAKSYMPDWPLAARTHWQMYENTSEGTPISPVFETPEELARWLADNGASAFADITATYSQWLSMIKREYAPSAIINSDGIRSGVEVASGL